MKTMAALVTATRDPTSPRSWQRWPQATTIVTALYVALVLAAPAMVRFAPDADAPWVAAITAEPSAVHCASTASWPSGCQVSAVAIADRPALRPLPSTAFEYADFKRARVSRLDYHVEQVSAKSPAVRGGLR